MTYLQFHLVFLLPALVVLGAMAAARWQRGAARFDPLWAFLALPAIAFVYTTPWDNYLVAEEVWTYPAGRVLATVGYVPVEEYVFFLLQPILAGLWYRIVRSFEVIPRPPQEAVAQRLAGSAEPHRDPLRPAPRDASLGGGISLSSSIRRWGAAFFGALTLIGVALLLGGGHGLYLGLILAWASPVLAGMWWLAGSKLWAHRRTLLLAVAPPTLYLWIADRIAIGQGIWDITDATRTGVDLIGLPIEEALFFLFTNLLVVQGLVMFARDPLPTARATA